QGSPSAFGQRHGAAHSRIQQSVNPAAGSGCCARAPSGHTAEQRDELAASHCPMPPVLSTDRIAHLGTAGDCCAAAFQSSLFRFSVACPLPPGTDKVDSAEGMATLEAMSSHHNFRPGQQNKLVSEPPIAAPDEHAQLVEADQRLRAALGQAIAAGGERIEAVEATVQLKRRMKLPR